MSDSSWVLKGVDPETRQKAVEEAERLGVSLADYLTDIVLRSALTEQIAAMAAEDAEIAPETEAFTSPSSPDAFAVRQRIKSLERRLGAAVGGLDGAIRTLDTALVDITGRVGDVEAYSSDTAHALNGALQEINANLGAVRIHISDVEVNTGALSEANDAEHAALADRCAIIDQRLDRVQDIAVTADRTTALLADAHELLKNAVAHDFADFARESSARLYAGLEEVRAAADAAAQEAEAAAEHLVTELRALRDSIEQRLADNAAETRGRMQAAFADTAERMATLNERVVENERFSARMVDNLRAQVADVEDGAQTALEETAETLRQAGAALSAELQRTTRETHGAIESVHADLSIEISELRERQASGLARLKQADGEINAIRNIANQSHKEWDQRFEGLVARLSGTEANTTLLRAELHAETNRIEECTLAALENLANRIASAEGNHADLLAEARRAEEAGLQAAQQLAHNITNGDAALSARITQTGVEAEAAVQQIRRQLDQDLGAVGETQDGVLARLQTIDKALARAADGAELTTLQQQIGAISAELEQSRVDQTARTQIKDVFVRLTALEDKGGETSEHVHGVARMLGRVSAQAAETSGQTEARLHKLEMSVADIDLAQRLPGSGGDIETLQERLAAFEERQSQALEALRADIVRFVADNDGRLAALETPAADDRDLATEFESLRKRIEERILGVEQRSVRTLEQVVDTVTLLEQRFTGRDERAVKSA